MVESSRHAFSVNELSAMFVYGDGYDVTFLQANCLEMYCEGADSHVDQDAVSHSFAGIGSPDRTG